MLLLFLLFMSLFANKNRIELFLLFQSYCRRCKINKKKTIFRLTAMKETQTQNVPVGNVLNAHSILYKYTRDATDNPISARHQHFKVL